MPRKKSKLDQFLDQNRKNRELVLADKTRLANRLFRLTVGASLGLLLVLVAQPPGTLYSAGLGVLSLGIGTLVCAHLHRLSPGVLERPAAFNRFVLITLATVGCFQVVAALQWSPFLTPLAFFVMIVAMANGQAMALFFSAAISFFAAIGSPRLVPPLTDELPIIGGHSAFPIDSPLGLAFFAGSLAAILGVRRVRRQSKAVVVGALAGAAQGIVLLSTSLMTLGFLPPGVEGGADFSDPHVLGRLLEDPLWAFAGGLISGGIVTCLLPAIERFFDIVTERRLLDLADPSCELLRVLRERAPGTYQHTLGVAQLVSNAAEAIGGDRLLAEVGAYYHDIGKIFKPEYFVENMGEDKSIHERLRPNMSKMIIISHVKDGVELALESGLPETVIDMIPMHHGTTVVEYFYQKARRVAVSGEGDPVDTEFRYPGAKPRFREAGILMLADMIEAMAKSESEFNPSRFRTLVHDQILKRLLDGQLNESDLTLNDLRVIEDSFVRTLTNMYHSRIKYPGGERADSAVGGSPSPADSTRLARRETA
jgi:putative nucleotidyltransferase with HDIG domain